ncbi:B3 domain-containing protein Os11g0197600-like [Hibiscus syriacus]|uniref:B3 domain-containing protein Os11g0197600-like n=1 Tax=Hibiscus syriacus TaxID=106335 RepID=UPI0019239653|nr:B3 domain-containing protein Os11g0197600-like [Hibiscus syriacus]
MLLFTMISSPSTIGVGGISACGNLKTELLSCSQNLTDTEKARAVQIANAFKSTENPVFMVVMRPSSVSNGYQMFVPSDFARKFLAMQRCNLTLCNSSGKTWPAKYYGNSDKYRAANIYGGWRAFVKDNHLRVGDICVFELIKHPESEILMKVDIYAAVENNQGLQATGSWEHSQSS